MIPFYKQSGRGALPQAQVHHEAMLLLSVLTVRVPAFVTGEYIVPMLLKQFMIEEQFGILKKNSNYIFVNKTGMSISEWERLRDEVRSAARETCERRKKDHYIRWSDEGECLEEYYWYHLKDRLAHTEDTRDVIRLTNQDVRTIGAFFTGGS